MTDKLFPATMSSVPFSSVVGKSLTIQIDGVGVVAQLAIMVPQPHLDYRTVAEAVASALMQHGCEQGKVTLVLPETFKVDAEIAIARSRQ